MTSPTALSVPAGRDRRVAFHALSPAWLILATPLAVWSCLTVMTVHHNQDIDWSDLGLLLVALAGAAALGRSESLLLDLGEPATESSSGRLRSMARFASGAGVLVLFGGLSLLGHRAFLAAPVALLVVLAASYARPHGVGRVLWSAVAMAGVPLLAWFQVDWTSMHEAWPLVVTGLAWTAAAVLLDDRVAQYDVPSVGTRLVAVLAQLGGLYVLAAHGDIWRGRAWWLSFGVAVALLAATHLPAGDGRRRLASATTLTWLATAALAAAAGYELIRIHGLSG